MSSLLSGLGLRAAGHMDKIPNLAPYYVMFHVIFAYALSSSRGLKNRYKIDHNVCPREDVSKYGEKAVQEGKITRQQLDMVKRNEGAHANAVENFPMFVGALLFAMQAGVPNETINMASLIYTLMRLAYTGAYIAVTDVTLSWGRSLLWWGGVSSCLYLLYKSGKVMNS